MQWNTAGRIFFPKTAGCVKCSTASALRAYPDSAIVSLSILSVRIFRRGFSSSFNQAPSLSKRGGKGVSSPCSNSILPYQQSSIPKYNETRDQNPRMKKAPPIFPLPTFEFRFRQPPIPLQGSL